MNAVEIEEAVSKLAEAPFDATEFPYAFLEAFGNRATTIKKLRTGATNRSDVPGGVLQTSHIHLAVAKPGEVTATLLALKASPATAKAKAKFVLATDGETVEAEDLATGLPPVACAFAELPNHFGYFLPLAGISTVRQIAENAFDIRATGGLNRLYVQLLRDNPEWGDAARRADMNHFMARLIFCFFAEDTDIFHGNGLFTRTVEQFSARDSSDTHFVIGEVFRAMNTNWGDRDAAKLRSWAGVFPYVNGGLFSGSLDVPRFSRLARAHLIHIGHLDWKRINPDIFGSMIQAVADDEERGALGMHYTSVPNILKVLNPLFLDDLRTKLAEAGDNGRMLLNLRRRLSRIRVFDPACGSGNFLVIAYREMRAIEAGINRRRGEADRRTEIPLTNFRGIEIREFPAEIARLALIIAEYQADVLHRGQQEALLEFLPLDRENWITCGNALRLDWLKVCPPSGTGSAVRSTADDLFGTPLDQAQIDFENEGGETYICGNPPYSGKGKKDEAQLRDMEYILGELTDKYGYVDYVGCWFLLSADYCRISNAVAALVATNSICQGRQLPQLWPHVLRADVEIAFAHLSFKWSNSAARNAGVICVVVGICQRGRREQKTIYDGEFSRTARNISPYLVDSENIFVESSPDPHLDFLPPMLTGSVPNDGGYLILSPDEERSLLSEAPEAKRLLHAFVGSEDYLQGIVRSCLIIDEGDVSFAISIPTVRNRLDAVAELRRQSKKVETRAYLSKVPHRFQHRGPIPGEWAVIVPSVSSERRRWFPSGVVTAGTVVSNLAFALYDAPLWNLALIASRIHLVWIATVCGRLKTDYRYSNTLGWNTFPVPPLTEKNRADLARCAEDILLAREAHFPATIADLYDPDAMPPDLRAAHERNDETLERIYIGRKFRNDTERLEKLFEMYVKMTATSGVTKNRRGRGGGTDGR